MGTHKDEDKLIVKAVKLQAELDDVRCGAPHCDPSVLHSEESGCEYCQKFPDWQELRRRWRINFTGENDPDKAPCPATHFRPLETINRWGGNVPKVTTDLDRKADALSGKLVSCNGKVVGKMLYFDGEDAVVWDETIPGGIEINVFALKNLELAATAGEEHGN